MLNFCSTTQHSWNKFPNFHLPRIFTCRMSEKLKIRENENSWRVQQQHLVPHILFVVGMNLFHHGDHRKGDDWTLNSKHSSLLLREALSMIINRRRRKLIKRFYFYHKQFVCNEKNKKFSKRIRRDWNSGWRKANRICFTHSSRKMKRKPFTADCEENLSTFKWLHFNCLITTRANTDENHVNSQPKIAAPRLVSQSQLGKTNREPTTAVSRLVANEKHGKVKWKLFFFHEFSSFIAHRKFSSPSQLRTSFAFECVHTQITSLPLPC